MKKALEDKDKALADAQKVAREKTEAVEKKLAAASKLGDFAQKMHGMLEGNFLPSSDSS